MGVVMGVEVLIFVIETCRHRVSSACDLYTRIATNRAVMCPLNVLLKPNKRGGEELPAGVGGTADRASTPWNKPDVMALG
jgi:hypothetical protein